MGKRTEVPKILGARGRRLELASWGGGVQSTAIALMVEKGLLPAPDAWLWADTGDEPEDVYSHVEKWGPRLQATAPFLILRRAGTRSRLGDAVIAKAKKGTGTNTLPFFVSTEATSGKPGSYTLVRRGCTFNYKREPLDRAALKMVEDAGATGYRWWLGISKDEIQRMKSDAWHPLVQDVDGGWRQPALTREDCVALMASFGETAPRSSCVFCPFRRMDEWGILSKKDMARVQEVDEAIEEGFAIHGKHGGLVDRPYLRRDLAPVRGPEWFGITEWAKGQALDVSFDDECEGVCGV